MKPKRPIAEIESEAQIEDIVMLEIPAVDTTDRAVGFYRGVRNTDKGRVVVLTRIQKCEYDEWEERAYPLSECGSYRILLRRIYDPNDELDKLTKEGAKL